MTNARAVRDWMVGALGEARGRRAFRRALHQPQGRRRIRHPAGARVRLPRLGRRALFGVVADRAAGRAGRRLGRVPGLARRRLRRWTRISATRRSPQNLPVLLALVGIWNVDALDLRTHCVLAYDERLRRFPAYLQQLEMESNGKSVTLAGQPAPRRPARWCSASRAPMRSTASCSSCIRARRRCRWISSSPPVPDHDRPEAHRILVANALAQAEALLRGKTLADAEAEMRAKGAARGRDRRGRPAPRSFSGNRPSNTILFRRLDGYSARPADRAL